MTSVKVSADGVLVRYNLAKARRVSTAYGDRMMILILSSMMSTRRGTLCAYSFANLPNLFIDVLMILKKRAFSSFTLFSTTFYPYFAISTSLVLAIVRC